MVALSSIYLCAVLTAATPDTVLLEFYSPSCAPCQTMQGTIDRLKKDGYPIQQINVEAAPDIARQYQIRHVPTCLLIVDGKEASRLDGVQSRDAIESVFQQAAAAKQAAQQVAQTAEDYVVRGQSPEVRRGLGLFNRLGGKQDAGAAPVAVSAPQPTSQPAAEFGRDNAFTRQPAAMGAPSADAMPTSVPTNTIPVTSETPISGSPAERALLSTVRLKIEDAGGVSFGTGTIIDVLKDEALVVTCGHIFRDSKGQGKIAVDLHASLASQPVQGQLISFDLTRDIALVSIRPGVKVTAVPVASDPRQVVEGARVFSIGCDHGHDASVRESRITAINKYNGSPNYTASGMPVQGRSGGGLFLADGTLIGICNAADQQDDEGLYAALGTIHWQLDAIGQTAIYQKQGASVAAAAIESAPRTASPPADAALAMEPMRPATMAAAPTDAVTGNQEIILIVRDKNQPQGRSEAIVIDRPTPELMEIIGRASRGASATLTANQPQPTSMRSLPEEAPAVIRGQNR